MSYANASKLVVLLPVLHSAEINGDAIRAVGREELEKFGTVIEETLWGMVVDPENYSVPLEEGYDLWQFSAYIKPTEEASV